MAFTSHGHYIFGSKKTGTAPKQRSRCYGPPKCLVCKKDVDAYWKKHGAGAEPEKEVKVEVVGTKDLTRFKKAQTIVENYIVDGLVDGQSGIKIETFVMTMTGVNGGDWRAVLSSNVDDNMYEVVYIANLKVSQIAVFSKVDSATVQDDAD